MSFTAYTDPSQVPVTDPIREAAEAALERLCDFLNAAGGDFEHDDGVRLIAIARAAADLATLRTILDGYAAEQAAVAECISRGLVFGWHPGFHHAESDPRRDVWVPQETGWWVREMGDDGADTASYPTLAEALATLSTKAESGDSLADFGRRVSAILEAERKTGREGLEDATEPMKVESMGGEG